MGRGKPLSQFERGQVDAYRADGKSIRHIAQIIGKSRSAVSHYINQGNNYCNKHSPGRPRILTDRDQRALIRRVQLTSESVPKVIGQMGLQSSRWTVWRALRDCPNVEYCHGQRYPAWGQRHIDSRLKFAQNHVTWTTDWQHVIFSDEKKWTLDGPDGSQCYWHDLRRETRWLRKRQMGGGSVMTWGAFGFDGKSDLCIVPGRMNSIQYCNMLSECLLPVAARIGGQSWIFQQENAPLHVSSTQKTFL